MSIPVNAAINSVNFDRTVRDLAKTTGKDYQTVLRNETSAILAKVISRTTGAKVATIRANWLATWGWKLFYTYGGRTYFLLNKVPPEVWSAVAESRERDLAYRLAARGLSKKSFLQIASSLGIILDVPAYVRSATWGSKNAILGKGDVELVSKSFNYVLENLSEVVRYTGGAGNIQAAIEGRVSYFEKNMRKHALDDAKGIAAKYPGLAVAG